VNFKKQDAQVRTRAFIKKGGFFLAFILLACITSSLIHETTTLMKKTLQALRAPFIGSNCLLDRKGLLKVRNVGYG